MNGEKHDIIFTNTHKLYSNLSKILLDSLLYLLSTILCFMRNGYANFIPPIAFHQEMKTYFLKRLKTSEKIGLRRVREAEFFFASLAIRESQESHKWE